MLLTLALVVFAAAIVIFFSQEFTRTFKRIWGIKGAKIVVPLVAISFLIYQFYNWVLWGLEYYRFILHSIVEFLAPMLPFSSLISSSIILVLLLTIISMLPILILNWISLKKSFKPYPHPYLTSTLLWLVSTIPMILMLTR